MIDVQKTWLASADTFDASDGVWFFMFILFLFSCLCVYSLFVFLFEDLNPGERPLTCFDVICFLICLADCLAWSDES